MNGSYPLSSGPLFLCSLQGIYDPVHLPVAHYQSMFTKCEVLISKRNNKRNKIEQLSGWRFDGHFKLANMKVN